MNPVCVHSKIWCGGDDDTEHALKEVDSAAMAWAKSPRQVLEILNYIVSQN